MYPHLPRFAMRRALSLLAICAIMLTAMPPAALASLDLQSGQTAVIADAQGDPVNLRAKPRTSGDILASFPEGTRVEILEGPIADDNGGWWYKVVASDTRGYMAAEFLILAEGGASSDGNPVGTVTGSAAIFNTNGDPINCRSGAGVEYGIVAEFREGDALALTGEAIGAWQPVNCGGQAGFVHSDYVAYPGAAPEPESAEAKPVRIVNTGGDPINCRSRASTSSLVLTVLQEGDRVYLRGNLEGSWQPVKCAGVKGYVHKDFLSTNPGDDGGDSGGSDVTGRGVIVDTNGEGLRCRNRAGFDSATIMVLKEGAKVDLRGAERSGWQPVFCAGKRGYVKAEFIGVADRERPDDDTDSVENRTGFSEADAVVVANTNGEGLRLRSKASASGSIITVLSEGARAVVRKGSTGEWVAVTFRSSNGFVHKDYLAKAKVDEDDEEPRGGLGKGDHAELTDLMNFRSGPGLSASVISTVPRGTVVLITGSASGGYYPVQVAGFPGYLHGDFLRRTDKPLTEADEDAVGGDPGDGSATPQGTRLVTYAMKYVGYPYVWATRGPDTFDCSGFTYWVTKGTLKQDIGAGTWNQSVVGRPVAYGDLRPGDLVFFQNTFTWGLSHVGIYIGDGKMISAMNEEIGVAISDITSDYFASRWYGARRITTD